MSTPRPNPRKIKAIERSRNMPAPSLDRRRDWRKASSAPGAKIKAMIRVAGGKSSRIVAVAQAVEAALRLRWCGGQNPGHGSGDVEVEPCST